MDQSLLTPTGGDVFAWRPSCESRWKTRRSRAAAQWGRSSRRHRWSPSSVRASIYRSWQAVGHEQARRAARSGPAGEGLGGYGVNLVRPADQTPSTATLRGCLSRPRRRVLGTARLRRGPGRSGGRRGRRASAVTRTGECGEEDREVSIAWPPSRNRTPKQWRDDHMGGAPGHQLGGESEEVVGDARNAEPHPSNATPLHAVAIWGGLFCASDTRDERRCVLTSRCPTARCLRASSRR